MIEQLNKSQLEAVTCVDGPVLVIAGAGSGKTRTLVYRVAHLLDQGIAPEKILLLTFTRKASQEMLFRASKIVNESCSRVVGGTFHGIANMLLRRYGSYLGYGSSFSIVDRGDAEGIINLLKSSLGLTGRNKQFPSKRVLLNIISGAINKSLTLEDIIYEQYAHLIEHIEDILIIQQNYQEFKRDHLLMDYDDLLVNFKVLLSDFPEVRAKISTGFSHIMVDEYQDTNLIQADIIKLLAGEQQNIMVVGDDSQSIYSFRGADFYNIMRFPRTFEKTKIIKLEENYRSSQPILSFTNDIIRNATEKYTKELFSAIEGDIKPKLYTGRNDKEEAAFIAGEIIKLRNKGVELNKMAVLFRSAFHSFKLEMELSASGIDYEKRGGLRLTEAAHMKDVLSFFRVLENVKDNLSWHRILLHLDRVGPKTVQKITAFLAKSEDPFEALATYPAGKVWKNGLLKLVDLLRKLDPVNDTPSILYEKILVYYQPIFEKLYADDYPKRQKDLDQLRGVIDDYSNLTEFVDDTVLDPPEANINNDSEKAERLIISTIHSAKGLEWEAVFVIGLAEGRFPSSKTFQTEQMEEERRLLYVAATRAEKYLYLCYPQEIMTPDRQFRRVGMSPLLSEIKPYFYEKIKHGHQGGNVGSSPRIKPNPTASIDDFAEGTKVEHPFFGIGMVKDISGPRSVDILFERHGVKTLHLDYAKLVVIS